MSASRNPEPGTVAAVSMMWRRPVVALFDGIFWRGADARGPIKCVPAAVTSIETPYIFTPGATPCATCTDPAELTDCRSDTGEQCGPCHIADCAACQDAMADEDAASARTDGRAP